MNMNANVNQLSDLVDNTRKRNIFIRSLVFLTVTKALAPAFFRYPIGTMKLYIKELAAGNSKHQV
ncbi:hypothetical protein ACIQYL_25525 [Lysinibacillus xylanilyticus]|uniref:hypothetical protein n=1 Tax=Lysinibacillus xylanilyticus TaxID=582475 RepID=UPI00382CACAC